MNKDIKKKWVDALRSGKYKQTQDSLKDNRGFCCLGVLCDLFDPNGWDKGIFDDPDDKENPLETATFHNQDLIKWAEVQYVDTHTLANKNDEGEDFYQIADYIEAQL